MDYTNYKILTNDYCRRTDPGDIADAIQILTNNSIGNDKLHDALYNLKANADNPYNSDYHRELYYALVLIADKVLDEHTIEVID